MKFVLSICAENDFFRGYPSLLSYRIGATSSLSTLTTTPSLHLDFLTHCPAGSAPTQFNCNSPFHSTNASSVQLPSVLPPPNTPPLCRAQFVDADNHSVPASSLSRARAVTYRIPKIKRELSSLFLLWLHSEPDKSTATSSTHAPPLPREITGKREIPP